VMMMIVLTKAWCWKHPRDEWRKRRKYCNERERQHSQEIARCAIFYIISKDLPSLLLILSETTHWLLTWLQTWATMLRGVTNINIDSLECIGEQYTLVQSVVKIWDSRNLLLQLSPWLHSPWWVCGPAW
jgi:hypothetical protein